jgi:outer membrane protein OmpA-like peptidoglycan-associated protein
MCDVWTSIGETVHADQVDAIITDKYIQNLKGEFSEDTTSYVAKEAITEEVEKDITNADALLKKSASVNFIKSTAKFSDNKAAKKELDKFIKIAKVLDGSFIQVEGNTDPNPNSDPKDKLNKALSKSRADTVKKYLIMNGIDANRIITIGNGSSKPIVKNDSEANRAKNRRTDISFKQIEQ